MKLVVNRAPEAPEPPDADDPFSAFKSEAVLPVATLAQPREWVPGFLRVGRLGRRIAIVTASVVALVLLAFMGFGQVRSRWLAAPTGLLTVSSNPTGAEVLVDGVRRGLSPLTLSLPTGDHTVTVRRSGVAKNVNVRTKQNVEVVQDVELGSPVPSTGVLSVSSDPSGLKITIDGAVHGVTPAHIDQLSAGNHVVTLSGKGPPIERTILIVAGVTTNLMVSKPMEPVGGGVGTLTVTSPIEVQLFEGDSLIGTSRAARVYLPDGVHSITAVNETLGFRRTISVNLKAGEAAKATLSIPNGALSVNAQPWAEVLVDGKPIGETPIGNFVLPIGTHEVVFRHPQLGERRQAVTVAVGRPARVSFDLRK